MHDELDMSWGGPGTYNEPIQRPQRHTVANPYAEQLELRWAKVWVVEPVRGDIYVVSVVNGTNQFVQLTEGGLGGSQDALNEPMQVLCKPDGTVIALPYAKMLNENLYIWTPCQQMPTPPSSIFGH